MVKRIKKFIIFIIICVAITFLSSFGFRFTKNPLKFPIKENAELVNNLKSHVEKLSFEIGDRSVFKYDKLCQAADYITEIFQSLGYEVTFQKYDFSGYEVKNIIAVKKGEVNPNAYVIVGAHYDTFFNPGADDNASGVAAVLEIARMLARENTRRSIKFIAFVNEEGTFFKSKYSGSINYIKEANKRDENIRAVIIIDMLGYYSEKLFSQHYPPVILSLFYPNRGNFVGIYSNWDSRWLKHKLMASFKRTTPFPIQGVSVASFPGVGFSDQVPFWLENYDAVLIGDTAGFRNPYYHGNYPPRIIDTYDTLDYDKMAEVVRGLKAAILNIAS
ncbi:MAG: M20/M25/M40 family metallo-hydrolase [Candidatus Omnitrophota bacterium]